MAIAPAAGSHRIIFNLGIGIRIKQPKWNVYAFYFVKVIPVLEYFGKQTLSKVMLLKGLQRRFFV